jgi:hypothetical protein
VLLPCRSRWQSVAEGRAARHEELDALKGIFAAKGVFAPRWAIPVLPVLAALGPYALPLTVAGVNWYAFRMLIMLLAAFSTPLTFGSGWWFNKLARNVTSATATFTATMDGSGLSRGHH